MRADSTCGSCHAPIRWARHAVTGKRMPLDPDPDGDGNVVVVEWDDDGRRGMPLPVVKVGAFDEAATSYRYRSHFASCPNAANHRRRSR